MTTKNIQDVVAERVEELIDVFKDSFHMTSATKADEEAEKRLFDPIRASFTTTLTQLVKEVEAGERERLLNLCKGTQKKLTYGRADWISFDFLLDKLTPPTSDEEKKHITSLTGVEDNQN